MTALLWLRSNWQAVAMLVLMAAFFYLGWHERSIRAENELARLRSEAQEESDRKSAEDYQKAQDYEKKMAALRKANRNLTARMTNDAKNYNPDCKLTPDGVQLLLDRVAQANGTSKPE